MVTSHLPIGAHLDDLLDPKEAPRHIPFANYMDACMFHPEVGYYGGGRVDFGHGRDYWTFAGRLAPFFGWMLAHRALDVFRAVGGEPFHVVELGGGEGQLLRDIAAGLERLAEHDPDAGRLMEVLRLISIDRSAALLETQAATQRALPVAYLRRRAEDFAGALPRPFRGLVVANELLDQMSAQVLRVSRDSVERLDVLPWIDGEPLAPRRLPELLRRLRADEAEARRFARRHGVRWTGTLTEVPAPDYVAAARSVIDRLAQLGELPVWVIYIPGIASVVEQLGVLFRGGAGAFLTVDYGGTTRHCFDPASLSPHLRTHGPDLGGPRHYDPFQAPGCEDITSDVDFGWTAELCRRAGLERVFYGHQSALGAEIDVLDVPCRDALIAAREAEGYSGVQAAMEAIELARSFRHGGGFQVLAVATEGLAGVFDALGPSLPLDEEKLPEIAAVPDAATISARLEAEGMPAQQAAEIAERGVTALHPSGSVVEDLMDAGVWQWRDAFLGHTLQEARADA